MIATPPVTLDPYNKRLHGQYFTVANPFGYPAFISWAALALGAHPKATFLEPFAGANNIIAMVRALGYDNPWSAYDLSPPDENKTPDVVVVQLDTLKHFPAGYKIAITNPPYLAKNSAAVKKMPYHGGDYEDLYQKALGAMLVCCDYVAAIIPETFIKQNLFTDRISDIVSLNCPMFDDTEHPVCLALFVPLAQAPVGCNFLIWRGAELLGSRQALLTHVAPCLTKRAWRFNDPQGLIGLRGADSAKQADIAFVEGSSFPSSSIKISSRHNTRISLDGLGAAEVKLLISKANEILNQRRAATSDAFMTAHRGLREDGFYRRRIEFSQARDILDWAAQAIFPA